MTELLVTPILDY